MCEIGKPIEIIDVEPLKLPAPLPRTENEPERQPAVVPAVPGNGDDPCREALTAAPPSLAPRPLRRGLGEGARHVRRAVRRVPRLELERQGNHFPERLALDAQGSVRSEVPSRRRPALHASCRPLIGGTKVLEIQAAPCARPNCTCGMYAGINMKHLH